MVGLAERPRLRELICPYEEPLTKSGSFVKKQLPELQLPELQTFDEIKSMLIDLANDNELGKLDSRVKDHVNRVLFVSRGIGEAMGEDISTYSHLPQDISLVILVIGAILHDEGKTGWEEALLDLNSKITQQLFDQYVKTHPGIGADKIRNAAIRQGVEHHWAVQEVISIAWGHHLKWNPEKCGKQGYPVEAGQQSFLTSIVAVADCFDAMLFRPYSPKYLDLNACYIEVLECMENGEFNPHLLHAFTTWFEKNRVALQDQCDRMAQNTPRLKEQEVGAPNFSFRRAA